MPHTFEERRSLLPVACLFREEPPDPARRFVDISSVARDEVQVGVGDRLPGCLATVDSDVHTVEGQFVGQPAVEFHSQRQHLSLFVGGEPEEVRLMATGDDQHVAGADREGIRNRDSQNCAERDISFANAFAERARIVFHLTRLRPRPSAMH